VGFLSTQTHVVVVMLVRTASLSFPLSLSSLSPVPLPTQSKGIRADLVERGSVWSVVQSVDTRLESIASSSSSLATSTFNAQRRQASSLVSLSLSMSIARGAVVGCGSWVDRSCVVSREWPPSDGKGLVRLFVRPWSLVLRSFRTLLLFRAPRPPIFSPSLSFSLWAVDRCTYMDRCTSCVCVCARASNRKVRNAECA
jgi:hypothetical protein